MRKCANTIMRNSPMLNPRIYQKDLERASMRAGFGEALAQLGAKDVRIVALTADLAESTQVLPFKKRFPERFVECGVAEQNMVGVAAGLALAGKIPFATSYAVFSPGRTWDQVRVSVCYTNANVKIVGSHAGITVGPDGATHQALEDIAITRVLPNMTVVVPCDAREAAKATSAIAKLDGPAYLRLARPATPVITSDDAPFEIGRSAILRPGTDVTIITCGPLVYEALMAARLLEKKRISAEVINAHTIKPFDAKALVASARKTGAVVTVEEHQISGGLFGVVSETLARALPVPIEPVGMPDAFGESGEPHELLAKYGMTEGDVVQAAVRVVKRKQAK
jgi:transketolase